ncbi:hypothetical protein [uncultured Parabacteroides sp.]|mgnify:CR=1 FL=1|uniref:hypothetical protein n=1 Tax=uncultured Parabacteroides sp. TaxID=512312 RepID=UPI0026247DBF|nr:hypothetical protein [uncultured Parabacteroides sp.]
MKKLIGLFLLLIFCIGCEKEGEEGEEPDTPIPEQPHDYAEFWGYHVKDTTGLQTETLKTIHSNDTTWLFAMKNKKPWFGMFNENTNKSRKTKSDHREKRKASFASKTKSASKIPIVILV